MKMEGKTVLAGVGVVAIAALVIAKGVSVLVANVQVTPGTPHLDSTLYTNGYVNVDVPIVITNNNFFPIGIKYFFGNVYFGTVKLANVSLPVGFFVAAGGTTTIVLNLDIPIAAVLNDFYQVIANGNIFDAILNKLVLNGSLQVAGNFTNTPIKLNQIAIPIA